MHLSRGALLSPEREMKAHLDIWNGMEQSDIESVMKVYIVTIFCKPIHDLV